MSENGRLTVMLVEDDENDVLFFKRALLARCPDVEFEVARDGEEAVRMLSDRKGAPVPDRIVLDLKLPRRSGVEVLAWIRSRPDLKGVPVTVLTSSGEPADQARIRELGVDDYLVKPVSYQELVEMVAALCAKWRPG